MPLVAITKKLGSAAACGFVRSSDSSAVGRAVVLGLLYGVAQILQTAGLEHTPATVSGFITGLYVVLTPLLAALEALAEEATRLVLRMRDGEPTPTRMDLGVDLVVRASTAAPRR